MRYESKPALIGDIRAEYQAFSAAIRALPKSRLRELGVWGDRWTATDLVAHLAEWQRLFLTWYDQGLSGSVPILPAPGYKWNELPRLNRAIWEKHRTRTFAAVWSDFDKGHRRIVRLAEALSADQLLKPGHFAWTGKNPLRTYLGANTASHYRFARKVVDRWLRQTRGLGAAKPARRSRT